MFNSKIRLSILLVLFLSFSGCILSSQTSAPDGSGLVVSDSKPIVVVSIPPQQEFVEKIAGDSVEVVLLVPLGANPHTYEPTPSQLKLLSKADLYITVGSGIEVETIWLDKIKSFNPNIEIADTHTGISLIEMQSHSHEGEVESDTHEDEDAHEHVGLDPHIWTSLKNAKVMVQKSKDALILLSPKNSQTYAKNSDEYLNQLDLLDKSLENKFSSMQGKTFFVFHPAWGYFANDYGLVQESIESLGKEPTPVQLAQLVQMAKEDNVKIIFASPQFSTDSAKTLADQIGGSVVLISPLERNYLQNTRNMADVISSSLDG